MGRPLKMPALAPDTTPEGDDPREYVDVESLMPALDIIRGELAIEGDLDCAVHVSKLDVDGAGIEMKVWTGDPDDFNLEALARRFGSGQYRVAVFVKKPAGPRVRYINKIQAWKLDPGDEAKLELLRNPPPPAPPPDTAAMMREMMTGFQSTIAGILTAQATAPKADPFEQMGKLAGIMRDLNPPAAPVALAPAQPDFMSVLNMVKTFNDVTGAGRSAVPEGASASETLMLEAARSVLPALAQGLNKQAAQPQPQPAQALAPPVLTDEQAEQEEKIMMLQLKLHAANRAASKGADADEYAATIYDAFDDDDLISLCNSAAWFDQLCDLVPACKAHESWYRKVHAAIVTMAGEDGLLTVDAQPGTKADISSAPPPDAAASALATK